MVIYFRKHLQVKSVLDPCEDENDDVPEDEVSLGADSVQDDDSSSSDTEVKRSSHSLSQLKLEGQFFIVFNSFELKNGAGCLVIHPYCLIHWPKILDHAIRIKKTSVHNSFHP